MAGTAPVVVVANPTAGRGKAGKRVGAVDAILRELHIDHEIRVTGSPAEMEWSVERLPSREQRSSP